VDDAGVHGSLPTHMVEQLPLYTLGKRLPHTFLWKSCGNLCSTIRNCSTMRNSHRTGCEAGVRPSRRPSKCV
jgi:hypothetical protein